MRRALTLALVLCSSWLVPSTGFAIINQIDGTIVPAGNALQSCLDKPVAQMPVGGEGAGVLNAQQAAAILPETFLPTGRAGDPNRYVTFYDAGEGAGYRNRFGWYHVGDNPFLQASRREIFDPRGDGASCDCPCNGGARNNNPPVPPAPAAACYTVQGTNVLRLDFACLNALPVGNPYRWDGRAIAFYLMTPEHVTGGGSTNPPPISGVNGANVMRLYFTEKATNDDGDFVHVLVIESAAYTNSFYFGWEDLFRGGDNDYEDMLVRTNGLVPSCNPSIEVCDGRDNDCDGIVDNGITRACGTAACPGTETCVQGGTGTFGMCTARTATAETCNGVDDDCNGQVDEGLTRACTNNAYPVGTACRPGLQYCQGASGFGTCVTTPPAREICDGVDNDCNGMVDDNLGTTTCGTGACRRMVNNCVGAMVQTCTPGTAVAETCNGLDDNCNGATDEDVTMACTPTGALAGTPCANGLRTCSMGMLGACNGPAPTGEVCDGVDNDCNGMVDDGLGSSTCGTGACARTQQNCVAGTPRACMAGTPGTETCNGVDDNCNGAVDEDLSQACTNNAFPVGTRCRTGVQFCASGSYGMCITPGAQTEICDGIDNDCDGMTDEELGNLTCGVGVCRRMVPLCVSGAINTCTPGASSAETCNGLDDNCNGIVDEGLVRSCMTSCGPGQETCNAGTWGACDAPVGRAELCNGLDDDCDGTIDNGVPPGGPCGESRGECEPGMFQCQMGSYMCVGGRGPQPEACNGLDDDCNGLVDDGNPEGGASCTMDMETTYCTPGVLQCQAGRLRCVGGTPGRDEVCNCMDDDCDGQTDEGALCAGGRCVGCRCASPCDDGEFQCPAERICDATLADANGPRGYCVAGSCAGVMCSDEEVCDPSTGACRNRCTGVTCATNFSCVRGRCVEDNCYGRGCPNGQVCRNGTCAADPCAMVSCGDGGSFCRDGRCVTACTTACATGQVCVDGICTADACGGTCSATQSCVSGACVENRCAMSCGSYRTCVGNRCVDNGCLGVTCPGAATCSLVNGAAQCSLPASATRGYALATGGGLCSVPAAGAGSSRFGWLALLALGLVLGRRARRRVLARLAAAACVLAVPLAMGGCDVSPYCLYNCGDGTSSDGGLRTDTGVRVDSGPRDAGPRDATASDGCVMRSPTDTTCDGVDDNCDGVVDEGVDLQSDPANCGRCGGRCELPAAFPGCVEGNCTITRCEVGAYDLNGVPSDGCEYACSATGAESCNTRDDDCDGQTDEGFDLTNDAMNCGACGTVCRFENATAACTASACMFTGCNPGFVDANNNTADGCEYACTATGAEVCNGLDDNCNGMVDETFDTQTDPTNCGACGRTCSFPNAARLCTTGACALGNCSAGYVDLDMDARNGCEWRCGGADGTTTGETCNGQDDDCDGDVDEGVVEACMTACGSGTRTCEGGLFGDCVAPLPGAETCNGRDDDCNGLADDNLGSTTCGTGACQRTIDNCIGGVPQTCMPATATTETCNGVDDNCNGSIDEAVTQNCSTACGAGTQTCSNGTFGVCAGRLPVGETCNGLDDNCNGMVDDGLGTTTCGVGACRRTVQNCSGAMTQTCTPLPAGTEICDGLDNNCNGQVDEGIAGFGVACGSCGRGVRVCQNGTAQCIGDVAPTAEICNGVDDNCDGMIDNGMLPSVGLACGSSVGACRLGTFVCTGGAISCSGATGATTETCNGIDDDCNGVIDNGVTPPPALVCNTRGTETTGVCAMASKVCNGAAGFQCVYPATYRNRDQEAYCDGLDNNCNGTVDEQCLTANPAAELRLDQGNGNSIQPVITASDASNLGAVYLDRRNGNADVFFNRTTNGGVAWLADYLAHPAQGANQTSPWISASGANYNVAYSDFRDDGTRRAIYANESTNTGASFNAADVGVSVGTFDAFGVRVVSNGARVTALWEQFYTDRSRHVFAGSSTNSGRNWTVVQVDQAPATAVATTPVLARGTGNIVYAAWQDNRSGATDIFFDVSRDSGATWGTDVRLDSTAAGSTASVAPSIASDGAGAVYVAWHDFRNGRPDIYTRRGIDTGTVTFNATDVRADTDPFNRPSTNARIVAVSATSAAVAWLDDRDGFTSLYANVSTDRGATWQTSDVRVQQNTRGSSRVLSFDLASSNGFVFAVWADEREVMGMNTALQVWANFSLDGGFTWQPERANGAQRLNSGASIMDGFDSEAPVAASVGGVGHFLWVDRRSNGSIGDIYYRSLR